MATAFAQQFEKYAQQINVEEPLFLCSCSKASQLEIYSLRPELLVVLAFLGT